MEDLTISPEEKAQLYLQKHHILDLLNYLTGKLLYHQPESPRDFLLNMLTRIRIAKITSVDFPYLMDDSNLMSMFEIMDPTNQGFITAAQYKEALKNLGLLIPGETVGDEDILISRDDFKNEVNRRTHMMWSAF